MQKTYIDKLAWIHIKDRTVLMTKSRNNDTWYSPGGKREGNETDQEALIREIKEELTIDLIPATISYYGTFESHAHGKPAGTMVRMTCYSASYTGILQPASEIESITYLSSTEQEHISDVGRLVFEDLHNKNLID